MNQQYYVNFIGKIFNYSQNLVENQVSWQKDNGTIYIILCLIFLSK